MWIFFQNKLTSNCWRCPYEELAVRIYLPKCIIVWNIRVLKQFNTKISKLHPPAWKDGQLPDKGLTFGSLPSLDSDWHDTFPSLFFDSASGSYSDAESSFLLFLRVNTVGDATWAAKDLRLSSCIYTLFSLIVLSRSSSMGTSGGPRMNKEVKVSYR